MLHSFEVSLEIRLSHVFLCQKFLLLAMSELAVIKWLEQNGRFEFFSSLEHFLMDPAIMLVNLYSFFFFREFCIATVRL